MRPGSQYRDAIDLMSAGKNAAEVSRDLSVPPRTVREWRASYRLGPNRRTSRTPTPRPAPACPICSGRILDTTSYVYLLGLYLGDGCISPQKATSWKLRIVQDSKYPGLIAECVEAMENVLDAQRVHIQNRGTWVEIHSTWPHWICLFPQHEPGKKHERSIVLARWQQQLASTEGRALIKGLLDSDGSRAINEVSHVSSGGTKRYQYVRYQFKNTSTDIQQIFTSALDRLDVGWTQASVSTISIARRTDVDHLDRFVGPKH